MQLGGGGANCGHTGGRHGPPHHEHRQSTNENRRQLNVRTTQVAGGVTAGTDYQDQKETKRSRAEQNARLKT